MNRKRDKRFNRALVAFMVVLLGVLILANMLLVASHREMLFKEARRHANHELVLVSTFTREALLKRDYQSVEQLLKQWAEETEDVIELEATAANEHFIAHYRRAAPTNHPFTINLPVSLSDRVLLNLKLVKDFSPIEENLSYMRFQLLLGSFALVTLLGLVLWTTARRMALIPPESTKAEAITEHKHAQDALRESEERYRSLINDVLDTSQVGICILDSDYRVVWLNQTLERYFCLPREDLIDKDERRLVKIRIKHIFEDPKAFTEGVLAGYAHNTTVQRFECHILPNEHREERWLEYWSQPIRTGLYAGGRINQYYDVTDRHRTEEALIQAQKMEAMGQLIGGVAHDFNNLLTVISGNMQILDQYLEDDPFRRKLIQGAENASKRGAELIEKLLIFSRRQNLRPKAIDLNELVANTTELLHRTLGENIEIETVCGENLWRAQADPAQVETSLLNLAGNARDAMPQGGKLTIEIANARIDEEYATRHVEVISGDYVMLVVSDTGTGMSSDVKNHAFEPFYTTKQPSKGNGLGLSTVYGFVKQSAGYITIYSEPGHGTSVKIYLPKAKETPIPLSPSP